jgi:hypothetical protein
VTAQRASQLRKASGLFMNSDSANILSSSR